MGTGVKERQLPLTPTKGNAMRLSSKIKHTGSKAAVAVALAAGLGVVASAPASASTIPNGQIQLCAQGNYRAYVHVLPRDLGDGSSTTGMMSTLVNPGDCWISGFNTHGGANQVDVVGIRSNGSEFYIGSQWWNSATGLGLGAEGTESNPYIWQW